VPAKRTKYSKTKAVKAIARKRVGNPPAARVLDEKAVRTKPKYKKHWSEEE
jgi:hypothetical protein